MSSLAACWGYACDSPRSLSCSEEFS